MSNYKLKLIDDDFECNFSSEEALINCIIARELTPVDNFAIYKVLNPKDYKKYNESLPNLEKSINESLEKSKIRLEQLKRQKESSSFLLRSKVTVFDSEIEKEKENIEKNLKRLESCK